MQNTHGANIKRQRTVRDESVYEMTQSMDVINKRWGSGAGVAEERARCRFFLRISVTLIYFLDVASMKYV